MRHGAKRLLALLTALVMVCSSATVSASATDDVTAAAPANITEDEFPDNPGISGAAKEEVRVYPPKSIIYGEELGYPSTQGYTGSTFTFEYEGVEGTAYGPSRTKPTGVGSYRVIASLNGNEWYSDPFIITYPLVTLSASVQNQTKYIFANSEYNSLERMPEVADTITGTYNGRTVTLIPEWKKPGGLFNGLKGSQSNGSTGYFGANEFTATTFTVKGTEDLTKKAQDAKPFNQADAFYNITGWEMVSARMSG